MTILIIIFISILLFSYCTSSIYSIAIIISAIFISCGFLTLDISHSEIQKIISFKSIKIHWFSWPLISFSFTVINEISRCFTSLLSIWYFNLCISLFLWNVLVIFILVALLLIRHAIFLLGTINSSSFPHFSRFSNVCYSPFNVRYCSWVAKFTLETAKISLYPIYLAIYTRSLFDSSIFLYGSSIPAHYW